MIFVYTTSLSCAAQENLIFLQDNKIWSVSLMCFLIIFHSRYKQIAYFLGRRQMDKDKLNLWHSLIQSLKTTCTGLKVQIRTAILKIRGKNWGVKQGLLEKKKSTLFVPWGAHNNSTLCWCQCCQNIKPSLHDPLLTLKMCFETKCESKLKSRATDAPSRSCVRGNCLN